MTSPDGDAAAVLDTDVASLSQKHRLRPRPTNDMWIAAVCLTYGLPLATRNLKDFEDFAEYHGLVLQPN